MTEAEVPAYPAEAVEVIQFFWLEKLVNPIMPMKKVASKADADFHQQEALKEVFLPKQERCLAYCLLLVCPVLAFWVQVAPLVQEVTVALVASTDSTREAQPSIPPL